MSLSEDCEMPRCCGIDIEEASILELQQHMISGRISSESLIECYLQRIKHVNPYTKSVIEKNPDALCTARQLDAERAEGRVRGPLHGIPFLVKDNICTKDEMQTTAGTSMLIGSIVPHDAHVINLLRTAGAIVLGHANMSEWASTRSTVYAEGYSSRGGQSRNPYNLEENPGGSSSGSAGAVGCNMCAFSLGTETDGSIIFPADRNGVVGIKPTVGLTSRRGVIPASKSLDTVGPFGRVVLDAALVLDAIKGVDPQDEITSTQHGPPNGTYASWVNKKEALAGARFGLLSKGIWEVTKASEEQKEEYEYLRAVIDQLEKAGAEVIAPIDFPSAGEIISPDGWDWNYPRDRAKSEFTVVAIEFYNSIRNYLSSLTSNPNKIYSLEDIVAWNRTHTQHEGGIPGTHPAWPTGQDTFEKILEFKGEENADYVAALNYIHQKSREEGIDAALGAGGGEMLDGLLVPILADGYQVAAKAGLHTFMNIINIPAYKDTSAEIVHLGYPMISIPVGVNESGVPFALGIIHTAWHEHLLIRYGSAIEDMLGSRARTKFLNLHAQNYPYDGNPRRLAGSVGQIDEQVVVKRV